jgi:ComF family protein
MDERNQPALESDLQADAATRRTALRGASNQRSWHTASRIAGQMVRRAADLVLPPLCPGCVSPVASHQGLCPTCWTQLKFLSPPLCPVHGTPLPPGAEVGMVSPAAIAQPPAFERARAAVAYEGVAARIITSFKYADRNDFTPLMARLMSQAGLALLDEADLIVPVPLHWRRLFSRRFNQSAELARRICALHPGDNEPHYAPDILIRRKATQQQVGLQPAQRALNVAGAFAVLPERKSALAGKRIVLVDDVFTTGATVSASARVLLRAGAEAVDVLTFARVLDEG